jgi:hypothetical protein
VNDSRPLIMDLTETAAVVSRSIVALGSLAVPIRFRFGPNDGVPPIIGTGFVVDPRGVVMTAGHVARALSSLPKHPVTGKHAAVAILFTEPARVGDGLEMKPVWIEVKGYSFWRPSRRTRGSSTARSFRILHSCSSQFATFPR